MADLNVQETFLQFFSLDFGAVIPGYAIRMGSSPLLNDARLSSNGL
jgi:hypothetical protein